MESASIPIIIDSINIVQSNWHWIPAVGGVEIRTFKSFSEAAHDILDDDDIKPFKETSPMAFRRHVIFNSLAFIFLLWAFGFYIPFWKKFRNKPSNTV